METLKKIFPYSFGAKDVSALVIKVIVYIAAGIIGGILISLLGRLPFVGWLFWGLGSLLELYVAAGIVILFLVYFKVIK